MVSLLWLFLYSNPFRWCHYYGYFFTWFLSDGMVSSLLRFLHKVSLAWSVLFLIPFRWCSLYGFLHVVSFPWYPLRCVISIVSFMWCSLFTFRQVLSFYGFLQVWSFQVVSFHGSPDMIIFIVLPFSAFIVIFMYIVQTSQMKISNRTVRISLTLPHTPSPHHN